MEATPFLQEVDEDDDEDLFACPCAICDNGGDLICCDGKCMRCFHATEEGGSDSGFSGEQIKAMSGFECKNCQYKKHQCFICGNLGSSDTSAGAEVFQCLTGTCRYFYHPHCVAEVLCSRYGDETKDLEGKIAAGEPFMCPLHKCYACKELEPEDNGDRQMQFAVCRRCPRAYHRKCLPRKIAFEDDVDTDNVQRAWKYMLPNKIMIYCLEHEMDDELQTPVRDHIKFPDTDQNEKKEAPEDRFDCLCAICDNGGEVICCDGKCMRCFHATEEAGSDSACKSLGFSEEQIKAMAGFECKNCQYKQHQCFICGKLGFSDTSAGAEVFQCLTGTCRYFYHPHCVAEVLCSRYGDETKDLEGKIAAGEPFMCPLHKCYACKELEPEDNGDRQMQFAVCRRCPRAYHRKCLPRKIAFEGDRDVNNVQRAWEGLLTHKILIYCLEHEMDNELQTPIRDHIKFPDTVQNDKKEDPESLARDKSLPKEWVDDATEDDATGYFTLRFWKNCLVRIINCCSK